MSTRHPAHLTLITGFATRPIPLAEREPAAGGLLDRGDLLRAVERMGELAPTAPLSFLAVQVSGLGRLALEEERLVMRLVAGRVRSLTRATDVVGWMGAASLGVLLQGAGVTAAGATAARLSYHLSQAVRAIGPDFEVRVSAATGTGLNWNTLPVAAVESLPDCG